MRTATFALFFGVMTILTVLTHIYLYRRLFADPNWPEQAKRFGLMFVALMAVLLVTGAIAPRFVPRTIGGLLAGVGFAWMGSLLYLGLVLVSADLLKLLNFGVEAATGTDLLAGRRELLARGAAVTAGALTSAVAVPAVRSALGDVDRRELEVKLSRLPPALSGLKIVQLSDVHVGPLIGEKFMKTIVDKVNAEKPDLVVITGDLVDGSVRELSRHTAPLGRIESRYGKFFVTGNHEYYSGVEPWLAELRRIGIRTLRNERVSIGDAASFDLAGIDDQRSQGMAPGHGPNVRNIVAGRDPERELVLLAHQPRSIGYAEEAGAGLQLSGHTHGGQLWPASAFVRFTTPYVAGLYHHDPTTQIYVSRGTGFWGPPMRLGAPAEITVLHLV
ncbi:MAG: metallophosphoesterase [Deltaproteobacteria bacterium]